jgi:hypothetical protein
MKRHWDTVIAGLGLMLGVMAMVGTILTDEYSHAASAEARGMNALFHVVTNEAVR